ncbi:Protein UPSTREAM OF FLC like [Actinidia chinensis var. chinensis]|uniref:Protein UPSTREAM OF FLC like n=1 Tax=Actinidia chinensis var. chinensis TaxID=1590841 RepID=A0A2R6S374_ACTCC|nr:Protein UPSTREAM OF FLC like [Actinidia chinensis var. chinensis]
MEGGGGRGCRETISPERFKVCVKPRVVQPSTFRKVQVVYYLSRNGQLEHPHFMEVTHLAHQHLRLKDVMERLTVLRGTGMPSLYSWSCKRSYKNGYVWNDLAENDIIHPSEGAEYVLKGSELIKECTEKFQQLQVSNRPQQVPDPTFHLKRKSLATKRHSEPDERDKNPYENKDAEENDNQNDDEDDEDETSYIGSMTPQHSRCSRGVSTDDTELTHNNNQHASTESTLDNDSSPPSTPSSDKANDSNTAASKRFFKETLELLPKFTSNPYLLILFEDGNPIAAESTARQGNSVLLQLISCGGSASFRAKTVQPPCTAARRSGTSLHKGVLCKTAAAAEEVEMIGCMSENPRFGNLQGEEREYFSGSIVEAMGEERERVGPRLKRSSSFNEERNSKADPSEAVAEETKRDKVVMKGKCIPRMKSSKQSNK